MASLAAVAALPVTGLGISGPLKILNGINLILDDQGINHLDSYTISLESIRSFRGLLFCKPVTGQEFFLLFLTADLLYQHGRYLIGFEDKDGLQQTIFDVKN